LHLELHIRPGVRAAGVIPSAISPRVVRTIKIRDVAPSRELVGEWRAPINAAAIITPG